MSYIAYTVLKYRACILSLQNWVQAMLAEEYGCLGLILYSDPQDYSMDGVTEFYPDSEFLPGTGVQRGTVKDAGGIGDPLTPGYPATGSLQG